MSLLKRLTSLLNLRSAWRSDYRDADGNLTRSALIRLTDLQRFCYANRSTIKVSPTTGTVDPLAMAVAEGRRECWLRIAELLKLDDRDLQALQKQHNDEVFNDE